MQLLFFIFKLRLDDVWFLRYGVPWMDRQMDGLTDGCGQHGPQPKLNARFLAEIKKRIISFQEPFISSKHHKLLFTGAFMW